MVLVLIYGIKLSFVIFNFGDMLVANDCGGINAAGVESSTDILDLVGRKWQTWADDII